MAAEPRARVLYRTSPVLRHPALALALAVLLQASAVAAAGIYRWTDADGKVHFGDKPPDEAPAAAEQIEVNTAQDQYAAQRLQNMRNEAEERARQRQTPDEEALLDERNARAVAAHCDEARAKLATLLGSTRQQTINAQGEREFIDEAKRQEWIRAAEQEIARHCS